MYYPYVYKITNINSGEFYIGYRSANVRFKRTPSEDLLIYYFTSSKSLKKKIKESPSTFKGEVLFSFDDTDVAYWYEQVLIREHISNPLCLNKSYHDPDSNEKRFDTTKIVPWNKGVSPSDETRKLWSEQRKGKSIGKGISKSAEHTRKNRETHNTPEYKTMMKENHLGSKNGMSKWIYITPKGEFNSVTIAAEANNMVKETLIWKCNNNKSGFSKRLK